MNTTQPSDAAMAAAEQIATSYGQVASYRLDTDDMARIIDTAFAPVVKALAGLCAVGCGDAPDTGHAWETAIAAIATFATRETTPEKGPAADPAQMTGTTAKHEPEETKAMFGERPDALP